MTDTPTPPPTRAGTKTEQTLALPDGLLRYTATAEWQILYEQEKPVAEMFHVAYIAAVESTTPRSLTFVFNGGPGAASAYLHMGALGPKRITFGANGSLPKPPVQLADNLESWLSFTDLVFVDPIGTGFSRSLPSTKDAAGEKDQAKEADPAKENAFWEVERDLSALGEFMQRFLSRQKRWLSPIFIAGESYGGFRVARLARKLQQEFGIGLSGAILISPALEFSLLGGSDYDLTAWATLLPSLAASAAHHDRAQWAGNPGDLPAHTAAAETFALKFERLYARATKLYFGGMARHLAELRQILRPGAQLAYVVGDQASYLRVMIRTGQILADLAQSLGYEVVAIDLFRTRLATATNEQMREEVVVLRWKG
jgi:hypothetical protein